MSEFTTSITGAASNYIYYTNNASNTGTTGVMRIGSESTTADNAGTYRGYFCLDLYNLPNKSDISKLIKIEMSISTATSSQGYNGCYARIDYSGTNAGNDSIWRFGSDSETFFLEEGVTTTLSTTDVDTLNNFKNLIKDSISGAKYWFRILKTSGMGVVVNNDLTVTLTYNKGISSYVYINGSWIETTPYVYAGGTWKECQLYCYGYGAWKPT